MSASSRGAVESPQAVSARLAPSPRRACLNGLTSLTIWFAVSLLCIHVQIDVSAAQGSSAGAEPTSRSASKAGPVQIDVPGVLLAEPASEIALPLGLTPANKIPRNSLVRIRGLPSTAALSDGHAIAPGAWAVPIGALGRLRLALPVGSAGKSEIIVTLVTVDGEVLAETKSTLIIGAAQLIAPDTPQERASVATTAPPPIVAPAQPAPVVPSAGPPVPSAAQRAPSAPQAAPAAPSEGSSTTAASSRPASAPPPERSLPPGAAPSASPSQPRLSPEARARAQGMIERGEALWRDGDIASARSFFERAAEEGLAEGALALGGTYDSYELARLRARGPKSDASLARRWYEKARDLGSAEAAERLRRLP
jgi:hypothetical protein